MVVICVPSVKVGGPLVVGRSRQSDMIDHAFGLQGQKYRISRMQRDQ